MTDLLEVDGLSTHFHTDRGVVEAVDNVDLTIPRGEIVGLVGESGSGKSVLAESIVRLVEQPGRIEGGDVRLDGESLLEKSDSEMRDIRGGSISMVFQDPMTSLNPTLTVGEQIAETIRLHQNTGESVSFPAEIKRKILGADTNSEAWRRAIEMLEAVSIPEPSSRANAFPHEFSGGMRQRAMIAMALSCEPDLLIADEPTTALDVTIQAQILDELEQLRAAFDTSILLITHDLAVVAETCDEVNVMYAGDIVERARADELFENPQHPYTQGLLESTPRLERSGELLRPIRGQVPDLIDVPSGCRFAPRCPEATEDCREGRPPEVPVGRDGHTAACLYRGTEYDAESRRAEYAPDDSEGQTLTDVGGSHNGRAGSTDTPAATTDGTDTPAATTDGTDTPAATTDGTDTPESTTDGTETPEPILRTENLEKHFDLSEGLVDKIFGSDERVKAVDGVDLSVREGETLAVVGESGCGKTTLGKTVLNLEKPSGGEVWFRGEEIAGWSDAEMRPIRRDVQMIFQDPLASLNPRKTVGQILSTPLEVHGIGDSDDERRQRVERMLERIGLAAGHVNRYPHQFSGGQQQRIGIGRALMLEPDLVVADEPVSALDVSVQAQILNLLESLKRELGLSLLFITHDLSVVRNIADRVAVMYLGEIVETAPVAEFFDDPSHPYSRALLSAVPRIDPDARSDRIILPGSVPSPVDPPAGCRFHTRCPDVIPPTTWEADQEAFREAFTFRTRVVEDRIDLDDIRERLRSEGEPVTEESITRHLLERTYRGDVDALPDDAQRAVREAAASLAAAAPDEAKSTLTTEFHSPCVDRTPESVVLDEQGLHDGACHRLEPDGRGVDPEQPGSTTVSDTVGHE